MIDSRSRGTAGSPGNRIRGSLAKGQQHDSAVEALVGRVVRELDILCRKATFDLAAAVGRLIIDRFYAGDLEAWRSRGPKGVSFRMLARHPDLPMSPATLYRSVAIYALSLSLPGGHCGRLSTSHLGVVLPLARSEQLHFLAEAEAQGWSVEELRERVALLESRNGPRARSRGGRKRRTRLRKTIRMLESCLQPSNRLVGADDEDFDLSPESARSLTDLLHRLLEATASLEQRAARIAGESARTPRADDKGMPPVPSNVVKLVP